jgi:hypothetical protein
MKTETPEGRICAVARTIEYECIPRVPMALLLILKLNDLI